jgi:hypothetical protein
MPSGAASRNTRPDLSSSEIPERSISAATTSEAIGSARSKPLMSTITPASAVAMKA